MNKHAGLLCCASLFVLGCGAPPPEAPPPPEVIVTRPLQEDIVDYADFRGNFAASDVVDLRARVQGFLEKVHFQDGEFVKKGDLLFEIEREPFEAALAAAIAKRDQAQAALELADANLSRGKQLAAKNAIAEQELNTFEAERKRAAAELQKDEAAIRQAQIDLSYTKIQAPFDGRMGESKVDPGNVVGDLGNTLLATLRKMQPIHAYFDVDERTLLRVLKRTKGLREIREEKISVFASLDDESDFPHQGQIDFIDNRVNPSTGTAKARAEFKNADGILYDGLAVAVRIPREPIQDAIVIAEKALGTDLAGKYLLVLNKENVVERRSVELGPLVDGRRVVIDGLKPGERYIVEGLLRARPGMPVTPKEKTPKEFLPPPKPSRESESEKDPDDETRKESTTKNSAPNTAEPVIPPTQPGDDAAAPESATDETGQDQP